MKGYQIISNISVRSHALAILLESVETPSYKIHCFSLFSIEMFQFSGWQDQVARVKKHMKDSTLAVVRNYCSEIAINCFMEDMRTGHYA